MVVASLAHNAVTQEVAHITREALNSGGVLSSLIAAAFLVCGVIATLLIPTTPEITSTQPARADKAKDTTLERTKR